MKHRSVMFDSCWGLAFAALAPLVIGTDLVTTPSAHAVTMVAATGGGDGEPDGWPDPCLDYPASDECTFFLEWLGLHDDVWSTLWDVPYVHGKSTMSIDISGVSDPVGVWDVAVWHDADLDYEDPDLTEEEVLDQIVAEGMFDVAVAYEIASEDDLHIDPDTGTETFVQMTVFVVAGTLIGETLLDIPVLGVINRVHITNSLGDVETVYNFGLIDKPDGLVVAMDMAEQIWTASQGQAALPPDTPSGPVGPGGSPGDGTGLDDGSGGSGGPEPPFRLPEQWTVCMQATDGQSMPPEECCDCVNNNPPSESKLIQCQHNYRASVATCIAAGFASGVVGIALCLPLCGGVPPSCTACMYLVPNLLAGVATAACMHAANSTYKSCIAGAYEDMIDCLASEGCDTSGW